ncbi:heat shock 70 kDa protein 12A-like isoform X2 [Argopecten irradians]|uniref:heat shock 70 kDa protein 12A-like isoform X2 n=1 Tax=Argopecten irradians TaxID=31199 RepID=UPI0037243F23
MADRLLCAGMDANNVTADMELTSIDGKTLLAIDVFSAAIGYLKDHLLQTCTKQGLDVLAHDIQWVLTVPAIWDDSAKLFMRKAAIKAGIPSDALLLALEPEAAAMYCQHIHLNMSTGSDGSKTISTFNHGTKYMVIDAGGGTVDITVHQVQEGGTLKEICAASGGDWGGTMVDKGFERLLSIIFSQDVINTFTLENIEDILEIRRAFEIKKRTMSENNNSLTFSIHASLLDICNHQSLYASINKFNAANSENMPMKLKKTKLCIPFQYIKSLFDESINGILSHLKKMMDDPRVADISSIIMVGGYSECSFLQERVIKAFPSTHVIVPSEPGLAVLKGAVITGHTPSAITHRVCRYTYGIGGDGRFKENIHDEKRKFVDARGQVKCRGTFNRLVSAGDVIKVGYKSQGFRVCVADKKRTNIRIDVYISEQENPLYRDGCKIIGTLEVDMPDTTMGLNRGVDIQMVFGSSELTVEATDKHSGKKHSANFEFI